MNAVALLLLLLVAVLAAVALVARSRSRHVTLPAMPELDLAALLLAAPRNGPLDPAAMLPFITRTDLLGDGWEGRVRSSVDVRVGDLPGGDFGSERVWALVAELGGVTSGVGTATVNPWVESTNVGSNRLQQRRSASRARKARKLGLRNDPTSAAGSADTTPLWQQADLPEALPARR